MANRFSELVALREARKRQLEIARGDAALFARDLQTLFVNWLGTSDDLVYFANAAHPGVPLTSEGALRADGERYTATLVVNVVADEQGRRSADNFPVLLRWAISPKDNHFTVSVGDSGEFSVQAGAEEGDQAAFFEECMRVLKKTISGRP